MARSVVLFVLLLGVVLVGCVHGLVDADLCQEDGSLGVIDQTGFVTRHGRLKVVGTRLKDVSNKDVQLTGVSLHGVHFFQCYADFAGQIVSFLVQQWGITVIRVPMYIDEGGFGTNPTLNKNLVDTFVNAAKSNGIYVIIDFHLKGDPNDLLDSPGATTGTAITFWKEMATKYKAVPNVLYEIAGNIGDVTWDRALLYHNSVISEIRKIDNNAIIIAGAAFFSLNIHEIAAKPVSNQNNVMYSFIFYSESHSSLLTRVRDTIPQIPLFVTEWGLTDISGTNSPSLLISEDFLQEFEGNGISYTFWAWAETTEAFGALNVGACSSQNFASLKCSGVYMKNTLRRNSLTNTLAPTPLPTGSPTKKPTNSNSPSKSPTRTPSESPTKAPTKIDGSTPPPVDSATNPPVTGDAQNTTKKGNGGLVIGIIVGAFSTVVLASFVISLRRSRQNQNREMSNYGYGPNYGGGGGGPSNFQKPDKAYYGQNSPVILRGRTTPVLPNDKTFSISTTGDDNQPTFVLWRFTRRLKENMNSVRSSLPVF